MSAACFGAAPMTPTYYYPSSGRPDSGGRKPWRWWRAKCVGIAARIRRSIKSIDGRRQRRRRHATSSVHHRRSFAPVYIDELYTHHHQPAPKALLRVEPGGNKTPAAATPPPVHAADRAPTGSKAAAAGVGGAMRNVMMRSPGRGGVLGVVKGMGEVDLRAELFIRKFKEDMRLQSQRSAEEFQAMLARGL